MNTALRLKLAEYLFIRVAALHENEFQRCSKDCALCHLVTKNSFWLTSLLRSCQIYTLRLHLQTQPTWLIKELPFSMLCTIGAPIAQV